MSKIKLLVLDIDGTLTDSKIYMGQQGEFLKAFNIKDGAGIKLILPQLNIKPIIITARTSKIVEIRAIELGIDAIYQGVNNKLEKLKEIVSSFGLSLENVAYMGDDIPDLSCMKLIRNAGGIVMCPADAIPEVKKLSSFVSSFNAGEGAVRDAINLLYINNKSHNYATIVDNVIKWLLSTDFNTFENGIYSFNNSIEYSIQEYNTKDEKNCIIESHRHHIDVQFIIEGNERIKTYHNSIRSSTRQYDSVKDIEYWKCGLVQTETIMIPGSIFVAYNNQPHKGAIIFEKPEKVRKVVCKIPTK